VLPPASILLTLLAADTTNAAGAASPTVARRGALPATVAVLPGVLWHGSGHFAAGDRPTALRLFTIEGIGLGVMAAGLGGLLVTGASHRAIAPFAWMTAAGAGLFVTSWLADLYGVLAPPDGAGAPLRVLPTVEARLGSRYVADPTLAGAALIGPAFDLRLGRWRVSPVSWFAIDGGSQMRFEASIAFRFIGPRAGDSAAPVPDGSFLDLVAGGVHHRYRETVAGQLPAAFEMTTAELQLQGRFDLRRYAPSLTGAFVEGAAGAGVGRYHYSAPSAEEANTLLLARFGFGCYLGHRARRWGEARVYYDHRHDDFAGGLKVPGIQSGVAGHFGVDGRAFVTDRWGFRAEVAAGAAWVAGIALVYRYGRVEL
jgi:hypothetical protein